jgi:hypothetical protein
MKIELVVVACALGIVSCCCPKGSKSTGGKSTPVVHEPATEVSVAQLLRDYKGNEVRGDGQYKNKRLRITGTVDDIKKDFTGGIYVTVGTGAQFEIPQAQCSFDDEFTAKASSLSKGDKITVECTCKGLMMNVQMDECTFH